MIGEVLHYVRKLQSTLLDQASVTNPEPFAIALGGDALTGQAVEIAHRNPFDSLLRQRSHNGFGQWVLRLRFHRQQHGLVRSLLGWLDGPGPVRYVGFAFGDRPGFIQNDGRYALTKFQAFGVFDEDVVLSSLTNTNHDGGWRR